MQCWGQDTSLTNYLHWNRRGDHQAVAMRTELHLFTFGQSLHASCHPPAQRSTWRSYWAHPSSSFIQWLAELT